MSQKTTLTNYERLQYFISAPHSAGSEQLNTQRIQELQKTISTKTCRKGSFIIDDAVPPRRDKKTEGVEFFSIQVSMMPLLTAM